MASYKVSYKLLKEQGESIKATAKLLDGYSERINSIKSKLGSDDMLSEIRTNLQKLNVQLNESRTVLNVAGELLVKNTETYNNTEVRQVKKIDSIKAHNRDFYKNPIVVASAGAGGATAGAGAARMASSAASGGSTTATTTTSATATETTPVIENVTYTENYTVNEITINTTNVDTSDVATASMIGGATGGVAGGMASDFTASSMSASAPAPIPTTSVTGDISNIKIDPAALEGIKDALKVAGTVAGVAAVGAGAGAAGGAIVSSAKKSKDKNPQEKPQQASKTTPSSSANNANVEDAYDPEIELEEALQRVRDLEDDDII